METNGSTRESDVRSRWEGLPTEQRNPQTMGIDECPTLGILKLMNEEDRRVPSAVEEVLEDVAQLVEMVVQAFRSSGRLIYVGAGTSGRLGVLDAAECPPTFGTNPDRIHGIIAGGEVALVRSQEGAEDSEADGAEAIRSLTVCARDVVVGIAASG